MPSVRSRSLSLRPLLARGTRCVSVRPPGAPFSLTRCRAVSTAAGSEDDSTSAAATTSKPARRPATGPRAMLDLRHVRENAAQHAANCERRNYGALAGHPARIVELFAAWQERQRAGRALREEANAVRRQLANAPVGREVAEAEGYAPRGAASALQRARTLKQELAGLEAEEAGLQAEMQRLGAALPNLTSLQTPERDPQVLCCINGASEEAIVAEKTGDRWRSHVHIGAELGILDFAAAGAASGWGWYYLLGDGARLEQALVQFALATAHRHGWRLVSPPSLVRSSVAAACGFQPRDQGGEQQTYVVGEDTADGSTSLSLTATAEIPLAALFADATLPPNLPLRRAAVSRCYRAEAGARGARTKGLYRVHEFTKVELFAWTAPDLATATETFDELVDLQTEILSSLGLPARVLEMPAPDLGASAFRKIDMEVFFPSRSSVDGSSESGWGEVSSASICTDYQTRRLATRARVDGSGALTFPWTLNGTALAVPRILAALLEHGWDEDAAAVVIPECLRPWMDGQEYITRFER